MKISMGDLFLLEGKLLLRSDAFFCRLFTTRLFLRILTSAKEVPRDF